MPRDGPEPGRVLVVDGEGQSRRALRETLRGAGFDVATVDPGAGSIRPGAAGDVAVVLDVAAAGLDRLRELRDVEPFLPVLVYTDDASLAGEAIAAGASGYVPKSDGPSTVLARLEAVLDGRRPAGSAEGEERYRRLVETSPAPINLFDADGVTIWGNDAVLDLLGLGSRDELVGRSIFEFIHTDYRELAEAELARVVEDRVPTGPTRMELRRADGEQRQILVSTAPGRFRGEPIGQAVVVDVTSLLRAREAVAAERRVVDEALDTLADVFFIVDLAGRLLRWNEAALDATGYGDAEFGELTVADLIAEEDLQEVRAAMEAALSSGSATVEARVLTADGERIAHEFRGSRLDDGSGDPIGIVGIARDLTDLRDRERQLLVFEQMLRHNVRHNVNLILGYADSLDAGTVDREEGLAGIRTHGERMVEQADKQKRLVGLIRDPGDATPVSLDGVVEQIVEAARDRHPEAVVEFAPADATVRAPPGLTVAVEELLENAIVHGDGEPPSVRVETAATPGGGRVRVSDDGPGLPAVERSVLSADEPIDQLHHGSGVGLWLVHWAVKLSGGEVAFEDNEPRGTVVTIDFPSPTGG